jgi:hypothetical protein
VLSHTKRAGHASECITVKYADLVTIDLSEFDQPGGKEKLAAQLKDAVHEVGNSLIPERLLPDY